MNDEIINRILSCLKECRTILGGRVKSVDNAIALAEDRLAQPMQLAIIGRLSSSKSTLVNALLGDAGIAKTDKSEETYNVSWIKYGEIEDEITIVLKNNTKLRVPKSQLLDWTSRHGQAALRDQVGHIEISVNNEFLKSVNIIDTPGLDSVYGVDSLNTIRFLSEVKPDAVVMLFTKSINVETLDILNEFQNNFCSDSFGISPMNAIGVMGKVDEMWKILDASKSPISRGSYVIDSLKSSHPGLEKTFQNIYPVSALLGLGSRTLTESDVVHLRSLVNLTDKERIETFANVNFFLKEKSNIPLSGMMRQVLLDKLGLFGIYSAVEYIKENRSCSIQDVKSHLESESGLDKLLAAVIMHFGKRAAIIKTRNSITTVLSAITRSKSNESNDNILQMLDGISDSLLSTLLSVREYELWDTLSKIYENKLHINDQDAITDLKYLSGESGYSAKCKLGVTDNVTPEELIDIADSKDRLWRGKYTMARMRNRRDTSALYRLLADAYHDLSISIKDAMNKISYAQSTIKTYNHFLYDDGTVSY